MSELPKDETVRIAAKNAYMSIFPNSRTVTLFHSLISTRYVLDLLSRHDYQKAEREKERQRAEQAEGEYYALRKTAQQFEAKCDTLRAENEKLKTELEREKGIGKAQVKLTAEFIGELLKENEKLKKRIEELEAAVRSLNIALDKCGGGQ